MPGKSKPPTWIGTVAGALSVHSNNIFKSGQMYFNETGWWALQEVTIPKANPENYRVNKQMKISQETLKNKTENAANILLTEFGRGKRQRKTREKFEESPVIKAPKVESNVQTIISPADCIKVLKIKKEPVDDIRIMEQNTKSTSSSPKQVLQTKQAPQQTKQAQQIKKIQQQTLKTEKKADTSKSNSDKTKSDFKSISSGCSIMAELQGAGYSNAVQVEDPFASLFDDMSVFEMPVSLSNTHPKKLPETMKPPIKNNLNKKSSSKTSSAVEKGVIPESLIKPIEKLNSIKPIEKVSNVKPLTLVEENDFLASLNNFPLTVNSDCSVRRLRRKLLNRKARREKGLPVFNPFHKREFNQNNTTKVTDKKSDQDQLENNNSETFEKTKPDFNHPALVGVNVLDKYCNISTVSCSKNLKTQRLSTLIGVAEDYGGYENSIVSPYTSRVLKPYIRRDFSTLPAKLKILRDIQMRSKSVQRNWPIDYCYVQPMHIPAVNALCHDFFWPGIDLTECLQYPEFSCVVMYRKILIGFAFMVPDVKFNEAYISFILVHPDWRRSGIASNMIYHLIQTCMGKDITLHVSPSNPSMLLYQKFGFKAEALILDFYKKYLPEDDTSSKHAFLLRLQR